MSRTQRTAAMGLLINLLLALGKLLAGLIGHSYALVADAIESIADIVGSAVIWGGLRVGARPADDSHPYGHGKAESLAAFIVAALVMAAGVFIAVKAVDEILTPHHAPAAWTLGVLVAVIIIKTALARYAAGVARAAGSGAVHVDAGHHLSDAITSAAAFIGISLALLGQHVLGKGESWAAADDWAALLAAGIIVFNGWRLARIPLRELMDEVPTNELREAERTALTIPGVRGLEKTRARTSGGRHYLEMHVEVDPDMSVAAAHIITGKIKAAIRAGQPSVADVLVHIEPWGGGGPGNPASSASES